MQHLNHPLPITLAFTGASGAIYGLRLLEALMAAEQTVYLMFSKAARLVIATETDWQLPAKSAAIELALQQQFGVAPERLRVFSLEQWTAPVASGSARLGAMVICPCSMGCVSAIATGASNNLIERAADVAIKEKRPLIVLPREMPYSHIHLENLCKLSGLGVTVMPASPGFYQQPQTVADMVDFVVARLLDHLQIEHSLAERWGQGYSL